MRQYVQWISKHQKKLRGLFALIMIIAIVGLFQLKLSSEFDVFIPKDSIYGDRLVEMEEAFGSGEQIMLQVSFDDITLTRDIYDQLTGLVGFLEDEDFVVSGAVTDLSGSDEGYAQTKMKLQMMGDLAPVKILEDRLYLTYNIFPEETLTHAKLSDLEDYLKAQDLNYAMSGDSYIQLKVFDYIFFILTRIPPLAMIVLFLVFFSKIKTVKGTILSVLPAGVGAVWTLAIVGYLGNEVSMITVLAPIFTLVIGSADGLHFIAHMQEAQDEGLDTQEALTRTLSSIGVPMILTTITSMVGFISLMVMNTNAIINLAVFASLGIGLAGIATWYVLPLILSFGIRVTHRPHGEIHVETVEKRSAFTRLWGKPAWILGLVVAVIFIMGAPKIQQEFNMLSIYKSSTEVYKFSEEVTKVNGGALPVFLYGTLPDGDIDQDFINYMSQLEEDLKAMPEVGQAISIADFLALSGGQMNPILSGNAMVSELYNEEAGMFRVMVLPVNHDNETLAAIEDQVTSLTKTDNPYDIKATGVGFMMMSLNESMLSNQIYSSLLAVGLVALLLLLSLRSLKPTLISVLPILMTLLTLFGAMGLLGISLNLVSCTIFSITIGVGIDYAIHYTSLWKQYRNQGFDARTSSLKAYSFSQKPILANAFGLSLGFSALFLSPLKLHTTVASLMWVAMMSSVLFSLVILPTLLGRQKKA